MTYTEFEKRVTDTFNRMHIVESCDEGFIIEGAEWDVDMILLKAMKDMFHIQYIKGIGYAVRRDTLMDIRADDLDDFLLEALDSFNSIMDKYNVVFNASEQYHRFHLHII
jgi:hypothetical protein